MRMVIIGLVFVAIVLAGGTAYLLRNYLSSQEAQIASMAPKAPTLKVLVASADMPLGTIVNATNTEWVAWPESGILKGYMVQSRGANPLDALEKEKHVARRAFIKGEPITMARLYKSSNPGFLRGALDPGMRAVAVSSTARSAAAGFILPGDRIDVILTHTLLRAALQTKDPKSRGDLKHGFQHTSETIMSNLRVLAIDQKVDEFKGGAMLGKTVLLQVTPKQAELLFAAKAMGQLSLVLRSAEEGHPDYGRGFSTDVEVSPLLKNFDAFYAGRLSQGPTKKSIRKPTARRASPARHSIAPRAALKKITIYRGVTGATGATTTTGKTAP